MSLVGREEVRMVIHCAWGLEYGSKPKARAVPKTKGTFFSHTDRPIPVNNCWFPFPALLRMANQSAQPGSIIDSLHLCYLLTFVIVEINECEKKYICGPTAMCEDTYGSYKCNCPDGFFFNKTNKKCEGEKHCTFLMLRINDFSSTSISISNKTRVYEFK